MTVPSLINRGTMTLHIHRDCSCAIRTPRTETETEMKEAETTVAGGISVGNSVPDATNFPTPAHHATGYVATPRLETFLGTCDFNQWALNSPQESPTGILDWAAPRSPHVRAHIVLICYVHWHLLKSFAHALVRCRLLVALQLARLAPTDCLNLLLGITALQDVFSRTSPNTTRAIDSAIFCNQHTSHSNISPAGSGCGASSQSSP